jgi:hypothetical protein
MKILTQWLAALFVLSAMSAAGAETLNVNYRVKVWSSATLAETFGQLYARFELQCPNATPAYLESFTIDVDVSTGIATRALTNVPPNVTCTLTEVARSYPGTGFFIFPAVPSKLGWTIGSTPVAQTFSLPSAGSVALDFVSELSTFTTAIDLSLLRDANGMGGSPINTIDGTPPFDAPVRWYWSVVDAFGTIVYSEIPENAIAAPYVSGSSAPFNRVFLALSPGIYTAYLTTTTPPTYVPDPYFYSSSIRGVVGDFLFEYYQVPKQVKLVAPPSTSLPGGWRNTGEFVGVGPGSDGTPNGVLVIPVVADQTSFARMGVQRFASLLTAITTNATTPQVGSPVDFTLSITNDGDADLPDALVRASFRNVTQFLNWSNSADATLNATAGTLTWRTGALAKGQTIQRTVSVQMPPVNLDLFTYAYIVAGGVEQELTPPNANAPFVRIFAAADLPGARAVPTQSGLGLLFIVLALMGLSSRYLRRSFH